MRAEHLQQLPQFVGHYGVVPRLILEQRYFAGDAKALDNWLYRHPHLLQTIDHAVGNFSLYQLTRSAARTVGVSDARAKSYGGRAIAQRLALVLFCEAYSGLRRRLTTPALLERLTGQLFPAPHVLEEGFLSPAQGARKICRLYKVYVPDPQAKITHTVKAIRQSILQVQALRDRNGAPFAPAEWLAARRYAFAILLGLDSKKKALTEALKAEGLYQITHILIERVPTLDELSALRQEVSHAQSLSDAATA